MRIQIIAFILLIYSLKLNAQPNLISNGEFETFSVCPGNSGAISDMLPHGMILQGQLPTITMLAIPTDLMCRTVAVDFNML